MRQRTDWVDYGKGIGIILVVYGHLLSSGYHAHIKINEHFFELPDSIIYSFHMPFFFFLTGLFVEQSLLKRGTCGFLVNKFQHLAYPYLIWSLLQTSIELYFTSHTHRGIRMDDLLAIPYQPWSQFWFLYALFLMYVAYGMLNMFKKYAIALMIICAGVLFFFPINTDIAALHSFSIEFLFFVFGILTKKYLIGPKSYYVPTTITGAAFILFAGSSYFIFTTQIAPTRLTDGSHPFYFLYLSTLGILFCIGLSQLVARKNGCYFLKVIGILSLPIYLIHMIAGMAARTILLKFFHINNPAAHIGVGTFVALVAPMLIYQSSLKLQFPYLFHWQKSQKIDVSSLDLQ